MNSQAEQFLKDLRTLREEWLESTSKNNMELATLLGDFYPNNAHFLYELLQNAEDAGATHAYFELFPDRLILKHNGRDFTEKDVQGITGIGKSTKKDDHKAIGEFGVGFKAVFSYTNSPEVHSGPYSFKITDLVCPVPVLPDGKLSRGSTVFVFPFNNPDKPARTAFREIREGLAAFPDTVLLFLNNVRNILWFVSPPEDQGPSESDGIVMQPMTSGVDYLVRIRRTKTGKDSSWLRFQEPCEIVPEKRIALAFRYEESAAGKSGEGKKPGDPRVEQTEGKLHVYFPAEKETSSLRFHIHAPFATSVDRASIKHAHEGNIQLRNQLVALLGRALEELRQANLLNSALLEVLPNYRDRDNLQLFFLPFFEKTVLFFQERPLTPMDGGGHAPARELVRGSADIRNTITRSDLSYLWHEMFKGWALGVMINSRADQFMSSLTMKTISPIDLLTALDDASDDKARFIAWLSDKLNIWFADLYLLLAEILRDIESDDSKKFALEYLPVFPCEDSEFRRISDIVFFSLDSIIPVVDGLHILNKEILIQSKNRGSRYDGLPKRLEALGIKPVSERHRLDAVNKQYLRLSQENARVSSEQRASHLKELNMFLANYKETGACLLTCFLDASGVRFRSATELFIDAPISNTNMHVFYPEDCLVWKGYFKKGAFSTELLEYMKQAGICYRLKLNQVSAYDNLDILCEIGERRKRDVWKRTSQDWTWPVEMPYLGGFEEMKYYSYEQKRLTGRYLKEAETLFPLAQIRVFWNMMRMRKFDDACEWWLSRYKLNNQCLLQGASRLLIHLRSWNWIPTKDGEYKTAANMTRDLLPTGFLVDEEDMAPGGWLHRIGFGENAIRQTEQQEKLKLEEDKQHQELDKVLVQISGGQFTLDMIKKLSDKGITSEELNKFVEQHEQRKSGSGHPSKPVADVGRREQKAGESHQNNPKREYKKVSRSVRTSTLSAEERDAYLYSVNEIKGEKAPSCQLCHKSLDLEGVSFPKDGTGRSHYFEAVELFRLDLESHYVHALFCPLCAAKYKVLVKKKGSQIENIKKRFLELDSEEVSETELTVPLHMNGREESLWFSRAHWVDIQGSLKSDPE